MRPNSASLKNKSNIGIGNMIAGHFPVALRPRGSVIDARLWLDPLAVSVLDLALSGALRYAQDFVIISFRRHAGL